MRARKGSGRKQDHSLEPTPFVLVTVRIRGVIVGRRRTVAEPFVSALLRIELVNPFYASAKPSGPIRGRARAREFFTRLPSRRGRFGALASSRLSFTRLLSRRGRFFTVRELARTLYACTESSEPIRERSRPQEPLFLVFRAAAPIRGRPRAIWTPSSIIEDKERDFK